MIERVSFDSDTERAQWPDVADRIHLPEDPDRGVFLQQGNYLDKELLTVDDLDPAERPINKHWSWDRILRSCFIKQADVLQGLWVFEDRYDLDTIRRNFDFYEPRTVHESSLSPSVHAVLAVRLGRLDKAHEMLVRTARLDLDDINDDTDDGCHTTTMAGTWIAAVHGFGGMQVIDGELHLDPTLAPGWTSLSFQVQFRGAWLSVTAQPSVSRSRTVPPSTHPSASPAHCTTFQRSTPCTSPADPGVEVASGREWQAESERRTLWLIQADCQVAHLHRYAEHPPASRGTSRQYDDAVRRPVDHPPPPPTVRPQPNTGPDHALAAPIAERGTQPRKASPSARRPRRPTR